MSNATKPDRPHQPAAEAHKTIQDWTVWVIRDDMERTSVIVANG
jgi:hypothetical protein